MKDNKLEKVKELTIEQCKALIDLFSQSFPAENKQP